MWKVCIDVGGTFTDCIVLDSDRHLGQFKSPTTPEDPSVGCLNALAKAAGVYGHSLASFLENVELLIHGTTLATNTLINRDGAKTGMITTKGFRDVLEIRRGYKNNERTGISRKGEARSHTSIQRTMEYTAS